MGFQKFECERDCSPSPTTTVIYVADTSSYFLHLLNQSEYDIIKIYQLGDKELTIR